MKSNARNPISDSIEEKLIEALHKDNTMYKNKLQTIYEMVQQAKEDTPIRIFDEIIEVINENDRTKDNR